MKSKLVVTGCPNRRRRRPPAAAARAAAEAGGAGRSAPTAPGRDRLRGAPRRRPPAEQALSQAQAALAQATEAVAAGAARSCRARGRGRPRRAGGRRRRRPPCRRPTSPPCSASTARVAPQFTGDETFFEALFAGAPVKFADLKAKAAKGEPLAADLAAGQGHDRRSTTPSRSCPQQLTHNVVGMVEGTDRR